MTRISRVDFAILVTCALTLGACGQASAQPPVSPLQAPASAAQGAAQGAPGAAPGRAAGRGGAPAAPVNSPEVGADQRITFRLRAPNAKEVTVPIAGKRLSMEKNDQGVWSVTTDPLTPDIYAYSFVVDGTTLSDPGNRQYQTSFTGTQSMVAIPGPSAWLPRAGIPQGAIARHAFHSMVAGDDREFFVYTPPGYDVKRPQPYPVLYLLHGLGDDAGRWMNAGGANVVLDNLIADGKAQPMVVVTTLGYGTSGGPSKAMTPENLRGYEKILFTEVMPAVEKGYHVGTTPAQRAIAGLSMGGATSTFIGLNHLDRFGWIGSFSGAFAMWPDGTVAPGVTTATSNVLPDSVMESTFPTLTSRGTANLRLLWIACGTSDGLISLNRHFRTWLTAKGVKFTEVETEGAHSWDVWKRNFAAFAPLLFRK